MPVWILSENAWWHATRLCLRAPSRSRMRCSMNFVRASNLPATTKSHAGSRQRPKHDSKTADALRVEHDVVVVEIEIETAGVPVVEAEPEISESAYQPAGHVVEDRS